MIQGKYGHQEPEEKNGILYSQIFNLYQHLMTLLITEINISMICSFKV